MRILVLLPLVGCLSVDRFDDRWAEERCALLSECEALDIYGHSSEAACLSETEPLADGCEDYDRKAGKDCIDKVSQMGCSGLLKDRFPNACNQVCDSE